MFGTEMHAITFVIIVIQIILLPFQVFNFLSRKKDKSRLRTLFLTIIFIAYNLSSGLLPDEQYGYSIFVQNIIAYIIGIVVTIYFVYYIYEEFSISPLRYFRIKTISLYLFFIFLFLFILPYLITNNIGYARSAFTIIPVIIAIVFFVKIAKILKINYKKYDNTDKRHYSYRVYAAYLGLTSICFLPIITFVGDYQSIEQPGVNFGYFAIMFTFIKSLIYQANLEYELIVEHNLKHRDNKYQTRFDNLKLTNREREILQLILKGYSYKEISEMLFITEKTVSKHSSNIFRKTAVNNVKELVFYFTN